jgi:hypothetical protein
MVYVGFFVLYGIFSITETMESLKQNPCIDLYANSLGFQIIVFILTEGVFWFIALFLIVLAYQLKIDKITKKGKR